MMLFFVRFFLQQNVVYCFAECHTSSSLPSDLYLCDRSITLPSVEHVYVVTAGIGRNPGHTSL